MDAIAGALAEIKRWAPHWLEPRSSPFNEMLQRLTTFHEKHGHYNVHFAVDSRLSRWVHTQRAMYQRGQLAKRRITQLDALEFDWNPRATQTQKMLQWLKDFRSKHGHCVVPYDNPLYRHLYRWAESRRSRKRRGLLPYDQITALDALGFEWGRGRGKTLHKYKEMIQRLRAFHKKYSHCNVPCRYNRELAEWIHNIRKSRRKGSCSKGQIAELDALGFDWDLIKKRNTFDEMVKRLIAFSKRHGHCNVPHAAAWNEDKQLSIWVATQRNSYRTGRRTISQGRIRRLDAIGFIWEPQDARWFQRYAELVVFKKKFGHCNVPFMWRHNRRLSRWVVSQRRAKIIGYLNGERIVLLSKLGFVWNLWHSAFMTYYPQLKDFYTAHGHCSIPSEYNKKLFNFVKRLRYSPPDMSRDQKALLGSIHFWKRIGRGTKALVRTAAQ